MPHSWHLCSKTCFILLSMLWLRLSLFVASIASCSGKASVCSLPILREHTATLVSSDMLAFSFYFSLSHVEPATQGSTRRLSALDQHWDGTQVANLCQVASMCFNRSRVVLFFYDVQACRYLALSLTPLALIIRLYYDFVKSAFLCTQNASRVTLSLYFWTYMKSSQQNFYTILNAICCQVTMYFLYIAM